MVVEVEEKTKKKKKVLVEGAWRKIHSENQNRAVAKKKKKKKKNVAATDNFTQATSLGKFMVDVNGEGKEEETKGATGKQWGENWKKKKAEETNIPVDADCSQGTKRVGKGAAVEKGMSGGAGGREEKGKKKENVYAEAAGTAAGIGEVNVDGTMVKLKKKKKKKEKATVAGAEVKNDGIEKNREKSKADRKKSNESLKNGDKTVKGNQKKEAKANDTVVEGLGGGDETEQKKLKKERETNTIKMSEEEEKKKKKREAPAQVKEETTVESGSFQEEEGEPKKKRKKGISSEQQTSGLEKTASKKKIKKNMESGDVGEKKRKKSKKGECLERGVEEKTKKQERECSVEEGVVNGNHALNSMKGRKNKIKKNLNYVDNTEEEVVEEKVPQRKCKKKRIGEDGETARMLKKRKKQKDHPPVQEVKVEKIKRENICAETEVTATQQEVVFMCEKKGNKDEVTIDQARRQALQKEIDNASCPKDSLSLGQWGTAHFEDTNQKQKFLRLMGGFKKTNQPSMSNERRASMALGKEGQQLLQEGLLGEFERAQCRRMDIQIKGVGLGFSPPCNKKFFIDTSVRRSVQFDD